MNIEDLKHNPSKPVTGGFTAFILPNKDFFEELLDVHEKEGEAAALQVLQDKISSLVKENVSHVILEVLVKIIDSRSPRYQADVLAMACGLRLRDGWRPATLAKKYGVSRTTASKDIEAMCDYYNLPKGEVLRGRNKQHSLANKRNVAHKL